MSGDQERDAPNQRKGNNMNKDQSLRIVKLLSALEVAGVMKGDIPVYLFEELDAIVGELSMEILK